ncbi:hypothetical protein AGABI1DRAFT_129999 [Agaricus bisporus var. burnettii JB137-S8]|uniref:Checkpoint protein RAD24-like helical bundle domain-containing protein n=1 Tax=Agaricus bisporus var. burnettii (strain JB137-S8 / ATCC MYA-4627 / FGSC 10392) TaxID=597362 RepID=K5WQU0_AGABU|nr:uncharacterized protein AGABI1DRAFT_129999 [Agaricus bisporus var. burnettii JB137-S8]EKM77716.1 hypothetical protein AGABI1DRAFT_129999 [Agaricus bisporus var. burnettii JB137-S8]
MPPRSQPASQKKPVKAKPVVAKLTVVASGPPSSDSQKRFNPLTAYSFKGASAQLSQSSQPPPTKKRKGKEKAVEVPTDRGLVDEFILDDRLWVDVYEPKTEAELAVHVRKVEDVRRWFLEAFDGGPSGKLRRYRRILALTGPSGSGKTAAVRLLAREMGFEVLEWKSATGEASSSTWDSSFDFNGDYESAFSKFETFLNRAMSCRSVFDVPAAATPSMSSTSTQRKSNTPSSASKHVILLEDLPNILHPKIQDQFHASLRAFIESTSQLSSPVPIVIIMSDATMRGETRDELLTNGGGAGGYAWSREKNDILDIRTVLPRDLLMGPYVTQIAFNPIAPTLMKKALTALIDRHFSQRSSSSSHSDIVTPTKEIIDAIVESSNGDIRSAIMALQFNSVASKKSKKGKKHGVGSTQVMEAVTRRESSLALFHLIGRVLYNKRKGDPSSTSASAKDIKREKDLDVKLKDPSRLPPHLKEHERRASRVDIDSLYADSPIDSSLFSLYIHQNYSQFCNEMEECDGVIDWLSWVDSSGGEMWYQANPHRFHLLTLGVLHSLPSPVPRRSQKVYKSDYFEYLKKEKEAWDAVSDTRYWMMNHRGLGSEESLSMNASRWSRSEVTLELGAILKLKQQQQQMRKDKESFFPPSHSLFSKLTFTRDDKMGMQVDEDGVSKEEELQQFIALNDGEANGGLAKGPGNGDGDGDDVGGNWLENDDIEEF